MKGGSLDGLKTDWHTFKGLNRASVFKFSIPSDGGYIFGTVWRRKE